MASSSDPDHDSKQKMAAALRDPTPVSAGPAAGAGRKAAAAAALQRRKVEQRARMTDEFSATLASARSVAEQAFSRRGQVKGVKDELRDLESQFREALTLRSRKEEKRKLANELISKTTTTIERLRNNVADLREKRDKGAAILSEQLKALESLEPTSSEDAEIEEKVRETASWYNKFLGLQLQVIEGVGGVRFVFDKIDPQHPEKEYSLRITQGLEFVECDPRVKDIEKLANDLDLTKHLAKFLRMAREKFRSASMNGTLPISATVSPDVSAAPLPPHMVMPLCSSETLPVSPVVSPDVSAALLPSPMVMPVNSRSEDSPNQSQSLSNNKVKLLPSKRQVTALSGASPGVLRRSPRFRV